MLKISVLETHYTGQFTLSTQLIKPDYLEKNVIWTATHVETLHKRSMKTSICEQCLIVNNLSSRIKLPVPVSFPSTAFCNVIYSSHPSLMGYPLQRRLYKR